MSSAFRLPLIPIFIVYTLVSILAILIFLFFLEGGFPSSSYLDFGFSFS